MDDVEMTEGPGRGVRRLLGSAASTSAGREVADRLGLIRYLLRWTVLGAASGALAGLASAVFLVTLGWATDTREQHPRLLFLLPLGGLAVGAAYHHLGGRSDAGNALIIEQIHEPTDWIPRRMAPFVFAGTVLTHLFGGSAGREGTAIQMAGSLTDALARAVRLAPADRRILLVAAIAGGFGSVFGVPMAGVVFALEVQSIGRLRYDALVPALAASVTGDLVVRSLGVDHATSPPIPTVHPGVTMIARLAVAGLLFGLASAAFTELTHLVVRLVGTLRLWPPLRPAIGGVAVIALTGLVGSRAYLGLSLPLLTAALQGGATIVAGAFALKLLFTAVTLGTGLRGGEVTPLFVIGATMGAALGRPLGLPPALLAAVGFVAVFGASANTPLACVVMGIELFGSGLAVPLGVTCVVAYTFSSHRGIYETQRVDTSKGGTVVVPGATLRSLRRGRGRVEGPPGDR